jgi:predicted SnoaL-like aldol condensation-catalyzing enzyme
LGRAAADFFLRKLGCLVVALVEKRYWSSNYIQHSAHIPPGRDGLFNLIRNAPATLKYEPGTIVAEGGYVIVHGRFSNTGRPSNWIAADVVRVNEPCPCCCDPVLAKLIAYLRRGGRRRRRQPICQKENRRRPDPQLGPDSLGSASARA